MFKCANGFKNGVEKMLTHIFKKMEQNGKWTGKTWKGESENRNSQFLFFKKRSSLKLQGKCMCLKQNVIIFGVPPFFTLVAINALQDALSVSQCSNSTCPQNVLCNKAHSNSMFTGGIWAGNGQWTALCIPKVAPKALYTQYAPLKITCCRNSQSTFFPNVRESVW